MESPLWSIKYHPASWSEIRGQDSAIEQLSSFAATRTCPNMILYGPPGTGKTVAAQLFAREFLGDSYISNYKSLNIRDLREVSVASAKRSVQDLAKLDRTERDELDEYMSVVYREAKIERNAKGQSGEPNRSQLLQAAIRMFASTYTVSDMNLKLLVLDEADALDNNMQQALRRTMEIYNEVTRFILITSSLSGWSPAILSRCIILRFPTLSEESIRALLLTIAEKEGIKVEPSALEALAKESSGDARYAINLLQVVSSGADVVTEDAVYACSESHLTKMTHDVLSLALRQKFLDAREKMREMMALEGYTPQEIIMEMERDILKRPLDYHTQKKILERIAEIDHRLTQARNPFIQLGALLASLSAIEQSSKDT